MADNNKRGWFRSRRVKTVAAFMLTAACVANIYPRGPYLMFRFSENDGGGAIYGQYYGWPLPYLRNPVGEYAHVPDDCVLPALAINLGCALLAVFLVIIALRFGTRPSRRGMDAQRNHALNVSGG